VAWVRERTIPNERPPLVGKVFAGRGCHMVGVTGPYGRIRGFLDRSRYCFFQVAPQLYSWGWVDPVLFCSTVPKITLPFKRSQARSKLVLNFSVYSWYTFSCYILNFPVAKKKRHSFSPCIVINFLSFIIWVQTELKHSRHSLALMGDEFVATKSCDSERNALSNEERSINTSS
jgi:hypothetical protein